MEEEVEVEQIQLVKEEEEEVEEFGGVARTQVMVVEETAQEAMEVVSVFLPLCLSLPPLVSMSLL